MSLSSPEMPKRPIRVLHVVGSMNMGGVETWLMNVLRNISRDELAFDFMVHKSEAAAYDGELLALGAGRYVCKWPNNPLIYAQTLLKILREHGPYDVIHSHVHHFSGFVLLLAKLAGVPIRIAHGHSDTSVEQLKASGLRFVYLWLAEKLIAYSATSGIGVSEKAAISLFGADWQADERWKIILCGVDLRQFEILPDRLSVRHKLGVPEGAFVIGHVGRFDDVKNHKFLVQVFAELVSKIPNAILLLIGNGKLDDIIQKQVEEMHLQSKVIFTGIRSDVPNLMTSAMDIFVFPSKNEGLGLVVIEAQVAKLTCFVSSVIPHEVKISENIHFIPLEIGPEGWAELIFSLKDAAADEKICASYYSIDRSISEVCSLYYVN